MSEGSKDEEITTLDSHTPAPPAEEETNEVAPLDSHTPAPPADGGTPIKPLDSHTP